MIIGAVFSSALREEVSVTELFSFESMEKVLVRGFDKRTKTLALSVMKDALGDFFFVVSHRNGRSVRVQSGSFGPW